MTAAPSPAAAPIADLEQVRFDRALEDLNLHDPRARVALDTDHGLAVGVDVNVQMTMPAAAQALPDSDRSAAASVLFLDQFGALFGVAGWHVLEPRFASPVGSQIWFTFAAETRRGELLVNVCTSGDVIRHVRVER
ncbi:MAG: hypothetical protein ABI200_00615 [Gaiellales bacterium]